MGANLKKELHGVHTCGGCAYYCEEEDCPGSDIDNTPTEEVTGHCHLNPPSVEGLYPMVTAEDWCSKHSEGQFEPFDEEKYELITPDGDNNDKDEGEDNPKDFIVIDPSGPPQKN